MYHKIHFKNIYLLCYHFILLALNFNVVVRILSLLWLPVKMCWFSQVIQLSRAIRTFIRTTLWRRGNCYCIGSLTIKTPLARRVMAPPWDLRHQNLWFCNESTQGDDYPNSSHPESMLATTKALPAHYTDFQSSIVTRKDHKAKGSHIEGFILRNPFCRQAIETRFAPPRTHMEFAPERGLHSRSPKTSVCISTMLTSPITFVLC